MTASIPEPRPFLVRFAVLGLVVWALATGAIRVAPLHGLRMGPPEAALAIVIGLAAVCALAIVLLHDVPASQRIAAMCVFVLPGMFGDSMTTAFCSTVFPNLPDGSAGVFGGLLLAGYAAMLAISVAQARSA